MKIIREITAQLDIWKDRHDRKPLILRGARQVGKTTLIRNFSQNYRYSIFLNLEKGTDKRFFDEHDDVQTIVEAVFLAHKVPSVAMENTLLFIDEIQESPKAIHLLRYFYEELPRLHVIGAGSLLEFALKNVPGFPVGRVEFLYLHPLNFREYLRANSEDALLDYLNTVPLKPVAHQLLMDAFHRYAIIGGMPEVVKTDVQRKNLSDLTRIYEGIWGTYKNDIEKYAGNDTERRVIKHLMDTAPLYLDERVKFQGFGNSVYRSREVGEAFRALDDARIMRLIYPTTDLDPPVRPDVRKSPRLQFLDTGLVNYALGIQLEMLGMSDLSSAYRGAVIPHLVAQELVSLHHSAPYKPNFWVRQKSQSDAEVDLLYAYKDLIIPIEVKSGATGSLKSLHQFIEAADHPYAIRIYGGAPRLEHAVTPNKKPYLLLNLPYYAATALHAYIPWLLSNKLP